MTTHVERSIEVDVPVRTAYDQWTQFEDFPRFMGGVQRVQQVGETLTHWVAEISGVRREWDAEITEQVPDQKVAWAATTGATNAGAVYFDAVGAERTRVRLTLDYEPEGIVEKIGDVLDIVERQAVADLDRFKSFIESRGSATGGWRGTVDEGDAAGVAAGAGAVGAAGVHRDASPGAGVGAGVPAASAEETGVPGDVVAVGPTGGTESTLTTEAGGARTAPPVGDETAIGHSGDPVVVDPRSTGHGNADDTERTGTAAGAASSSDVGVAGFGTDTGLTSSPTSGVLTGDPGSHAASRTGTGTDDTERTGTAAGAASSPAAGVAGFGTNTGLSSDDPNSGVFTGDPGARTASHAGRTGDLVGEVGRGGHHEAWTDEPGARDSVTEASTDPVGEDWDSAGSATTGTDEAWSSAGSGPGEDRDVRTSGGEGVVKRDFADEDISTDDVVARDFANRDVSGEGVVERDFANRDITERDIANRGVTEEPTSLDAADAPGPADGVGAGLDPLDPRAGTADDPDNPVRPSV